MCICFQPFLLFYFRMKQKTVLRIEVFASEFSLRFQRAFPEHAFLGTCLHRGLPYRVREVGAEGMAGPENKHVEKSQYL